MHLCMLLGAPAFWDRRGVPRFVYGEEMEKRFNVDVYCSTNSDIHYLSRRSLLSQSFLDGF